MILCINPSCPKPENPDHHNYCQGCGSELMLVGKYRVIRLLSAKGGFAQTYEVIDLDHNTPKVLKVLTYRSDKAINLFQKEAEVLSKLNHPGIPKGEGLFIFNPKHSENPLHCLVMAKIEGLDLEEYQKKNNFQPLTQEKALDWLLQLVIILREVHKRNFFHRDIKPSNIIVTPNNQLVLIDFGAVRQITGTILSGGKVTGIYTPGYAPPEQERGYAVPESDFFALGRTFVYLLTGKDPSDSQLYNYKENKLQWRPLAPQISPKFADFIDQLMALKPSDRPRNTQVILEKLSQMQRQFNTFPKNFNRNNQGIVNYYYANFWTRLQASLIDTLITISVAGFFGYLSGKSFLASGLEPPFNVQNITFLIESSLIASFSTTIWGAIFVKIWLLKEIFDDFINGNNNYYYYFLMIILGGITKWLYFVILECSWVEGTLGKKILGIKVINLEGHRISFKQANQRYWGKFISSLIFYVGFLPIFSKRKQALHDKISRCLIVKN